MFKQLTLLLLLSCSLLFVQCSDDEIDEPEMENNEEMEMTVDEETVSFSKADGADPTNANNQDRITDNVWITRGNTGGQIFNAAAESDADKEDSPVGTRWALGTTANLENLDFSTFRGTGKPQDLVNRNLVLHLVEDDIFINVRITSWSAGREDAGGFAYTRTKL